MGDSAQELIRRGYTARAEDRLTDALAAFNEAVEQCRREGPEHASLPEALSGLARIETDLKDLDSALSHYGEVEAICRRSGEAIGLAHALRRSGDLLRKQDRLAQADKNYSEAIEIYRIHGEEVALHLANALRGSALLAAARERVDTSIAYWTEARQLYAVLGIQAGVDESAVQLLSLAKKQHQESAARSASGA